MIVKKIMILVFLLINFTTIAQIQENTLSSDILGSFLLDGYEILDFDTALINNDLIIDYIVVLKKIEEKEFDLRPLVLYVSNLKGEYVVQFRNDNAIYPYLSSEVFSGIDFDRNSIMINYYYGMATRLKETYKFKYDRKDNNWILSKKITISDNIYDSIPPETDTIDYLGKTKILINEFSIIKLEE